MTNTLALSVTVCQDASVTNQETSESSVRQTDGALADRTVVVSGAGGGIGSAVVERCLAEGANVVAFDLAGLGLVELKKRAGQKLLVLEADVTSSVDWERVRDAAQASFGSINGLINNAGIEGSMSPLVEYPEQVFDQVLAVNVKGVFLGMKTIAPAMTGDTKSVVNVSSVAGLAGASGLGAYVASKHAVIGLTKTAAIELASDGIRCNAVCPAPIRTRMMDSLIDSMKSDEMDAETIEGLIAGSIPLGRIGDAAEVAALMVFLLSNDASFISGAAIPVDGAMKAR